MTLRCPSPMALAGTLLTLSCGLLAPTTASADSVNPNASASTATASYRLTTSTGISTPSSDIQGPQVIAMVLPPGSVVPPANADGTQGSPLTILPDSSGFDQSQLVVALKDTTGADGSPEQLFGLVFFGKGLDAGGDLHFSLSINGALASNPPVLESLTPGVTITSDAPASGGSGSGSNPGGGSGEGPTGGDGTSVPEPLSMALWSSVLVGIAARRRLQPRR
ncbi:hypothetical protein OJF2_04990 [Aquisphaera giovannonii]|uniref:PEP-CTERM protein-sorting domain-containing protein n=1 Tax=Aquisphaera giovannonii TaxID=406548 RepID=A0A5B9VWE3_9BACT|nr:hypothetical protein [Aquisphaera giovannonii]QEH32030.1 hypothetical protein OJF2_04990 [Aquisphaera giovannonii]